MRKKLCKIRGLRVLGSYFRYILSYINNPSNRKRLKVTSYRNTAILRNKLVNLLIFSLTEKFKSFPPPRASFHDLFKRSNAMLLVLFDYQLICESLYLLKLTLLFWFHVLCVICPVEVLCLNRKDWWSLVIVLISSF